MLQRMPSTNMFLPRRESATSLLQAESSGTSIRRKPPLWSTSTVSRYEATTFGSRCSRHMLSRRMVQPGLSSPSRTRPSSTCSLNATTRSVSSPPLVTLPDPMRMRMPLAPATLRAGGWISAGMISVVQMPLPILAAIAPSDWPQRCAPSPESLITSTMCSAIVTADFSRVLVSVSIMVINRHGLAHGCALAGRCRTACPRSPEVPAGRARRYREAPAMPSCPGQPCVPRPWPG